MIVLRNRLVDMGARWTSVPRTFLCAECNRIVAESWKGVRWTKRSIDSTSTIWFAMQPSPFRNRKRPSVLKEIDPALWFPRLVECEDRPYRRRIRCIRARYRPIPDDAALDRINPNYGLASPRRRLVEDVRRAPRKRAPQQRADLQLLPRSPVPRFRKS